MNFVVFVLGLGLFGGSLFGLAVSSEVGGVRSETCAPPRGELIVRHLLMPGHLKCCWRPVAEWLSENLPGVKVNVRSGFWPAWHARKHVDFQNPLAASEDEAAIAVAHNLGLNLIS